MINASSPDPETPREYTLGIPYLVSAIRADGPYDIQVLDYFNRPWRETEKSTVAMLESFQPEVVLISCFTINRIAGCKTAGLVKEYNPSVKVVMGGFHPSFMYRQILTHYPVDAVCIGEGEQTVVELLQAYKAKVSVAGVRGIAYKKDGVIVQTGKRSFIKELDTIPFPAHDVYSDYIKKNKQGNIISSRGCPFGCQFCSTTEFWGRKWRERSVKNVVDEIEMLVKNYSVEHINFMDDEFTLNRIRAIGISREIIKRSLKIDWICSTRVSSVDRELLDWMKSSGCKHVALGVESGSPKILESTGKKITVEQIIKGFELLREYGLSRGVFLMVGNPGENRSTVRETIRLVKRLRLEVDSVAVAEIYPGSRLYEMAKSKRFITDDYWLAENPPPFYTVEQSAEKLQWWSFLIVLSSKRDQGVLTLARFLGWYLLSKRKKIMKYMVRVLDIFFLGKKKDHSYKKY